MKLAIILVIGVAGAVSIGSALFLKAGAPPHVAIVTGPAGLTSVKSDDTEFLKAGDFHVDQVSIRRPSGETYGGSTTGVSAFDQSHRELTLTFPWGSVKTVYEADGSHLTLRIKTTNSSDSETIAGLRYTPLVMQFPEKVKEYDGSIPLLAHNIGQVAAVKVSYGSGVLAIVSEDVEKPIMIGFPWALNKPANTEFPLSVHTDRVSSYPDSYPTINRPIPPKASDEYIVSLRFGRNRATEHSLVGDVEKEFVAAFPPQLNWPDRRPIGAIFLATDPDRWTTNPRGWFGDANLNVITSGGKAEFRQRILKLADGAISIMHDMNAQGAITWDIEGKEFRRATTYIGDPRVVETLAPEMAGVVDEYFGRIRAAGLRTGVCVRPQALKVAPNRSDVSEVPVEDPASVLIDKIGYAKKRWGVSLVYIDSNVNGNDPNPLDATVMQKVATTFPDVLLIPEHSTLRYYAYTAPFTELRKGVVSTPDDMREVYPKAFSLIYTADGPLDLYRDNLRAAVKRGDSLMYRTWFPDPQNEKVKSIYKP